MPNIKIKCDTTNRLVQIQKLGMAVSCSINLENQMEVLMYLYPNNLKGRPMLWLWHMKDVVVIGIILLLSIFILIQFNLILPLALTAIYAILTLRLEHLSILDFIVYAINFFILEPQAFTWHKEKEYLTIEGEQTNEI